MQRLVAALSKLPSIGEKTATRLAYHLITQDKESAQKIALALNEATQAIGLCKNCFFLAEEEFCTICQKEGRDKSVLCVVEKPSDILSIERSAEYRGYYHVLHGLWAPLRGLGPKDMKLKELLERLKTGEITEIIIALSSTVEGEATAMFIAQQVSDFGIKVTRLAQGMPKGGELEYADDLTLARALSGRVSLR